MRSLAHLIQPSQKLFGGVPLRRAFAGIGLGGGLLMVAACHRGAPKLGPTGTGCARSESPASSNQTTPALNRATFDSVWSIVAASHWDKSYNGVNWKAVGDSLRPKALRARNVVELRAVLSDMLGTLKQSHFSIIPQELGAGLGTADRDYSGDIGATIRDVDGAILVTHVRAGGAAARAGMRPGFVIQAVDGCVVAGRDASDTTEMDDRRARMTHWSSVTHRLRGLVGDTVRVLARDDRDKLTVYSIKREAVRDSITKVGNLPTMSARLETERRVEGSRNIGVIRFNMWMPVLSEAIRFAMDSLRGSDGIVLDLRGNVGGIGVMASGVAGYFVDSALTLGTMIQQGSTQKYIINPQRVDSRNQRVKPYAGPLAIVVDELSISTSEIFAGGLQSINRARIFGSQTAGEALPSVAERLPNGDVLYHAIANFLGPTGRPVEGAGVVPDVAVPVTRAFLLKGRDPALDAAVSWAASSGKGLTGRP